MQDPCSPKTKRMPIERGKFQRYTVNYGYSKLSEQVEWELQPQRQHASRLVADMRAIQHRQYAEASYRQRRMQTPLVRSRRIAKLSRIASSRVAK